LIVGQRLRVIRESKKLSQGDIEERTGLLRCYTSRVENGHTVPSLETLEKYARAMEIELYQLFFDSNQKEPQELGLPGPAAAKLSRKDAILLSRLGRMLVRMNDSDKHLLVGLAQKLAARS
jgi:transcriptional regulator with XRE-family HTH domain